LGISEREIQSFESRKIPKQFKNVTKEIQNLVRKIKLIDNFKNGYLGIWVLGMDMTYVNVNASNIG
jgi:hypothetical protein